MYKFIIFFLFYSGFIFSQEQATSHVVLQFIGDIMGHGPQIKAAYNSSIKTYNYDSNFQYVKNIFANANFTIGNLEVNLGIKPYAGYPTFSSPPALAQAIKNAGIDILGTANNHSCDRRKKGIVNTIHVLDSLRIQHSGTFINKADKDSLSPLIIEKNNIKIALLNYTYGTNGIAVPKPTVVNLLNKEIILQDIAKAQKQQPDVIIAFVHWGQQYKDLAVASQKRWFQFFRDNGVNIVIGSHPHVVEPMEWDKENNTLVVYSLGNFISNQRTFPRDGAVIFEMELTKNRNKTTISRADYIATWVYKITYENGLDYQVLPIDEFQYKAHYFLKKTDYDKMMTYYKHLQDLLKTNNINISENKLFTNDMVRLMHALF